MASPAQRFDVIVVGYGPVGASCALLLRQRGLSVAVVERETSVFPLPRAALFDGEIARVFQNLGVLQRLGEAVQPLPGAGFRTAHGAPIGPDLEMPLDVAGPQGHHDSLVFHQPVLERVLRERARELGVAVWLGHTAEPPEQHGDTVHVRARPASGAEPVRLEADWLVAADGASSPIREGLGIDWGSLGYDRDWLVMDVLVEDPALQLPRLGLQVCDPQRIHTFVPLCGARRRWEFIFNPGETREEMLRESRQWELLAPYLKPGQARIERAAAYQFHSAISARWRAGRILLAGDAAHQTPPFLGQGMCTGIRDAANLAWKIEHVQRGRMSPAVLDSYETERKPHALDTVDHAVAIGRLMDAFAAAQLDGNWPTDLSALYGGSRTRERLREGMFSTAQEGLGTTGALAPQPRLREQGASLLLDDLAGTGFRLLCSSGVAAALGNEERELAARTGTTLVPLDLDRLDGASPESVLGEYTAILVRPDHYVFGVARDPSRVASLLRELGSHFRP